MKNIILTLGLLVISTSTIFTQSYSAYKYTASRRLNACYPANNFQGLDISPNRLLAKYPCEVRSKSDALGAIVVHCTDSPLGQGSVVILFIKNPRECDRALEALQQM